jgi:hypothetical protein
MKIFVKKINPQEWGYRSGVPNKGGKYLLIPIAFWDFFPDLTAAIRNSFSTIRVGLPSGGHVGLFYVWNNTFMFPETGLKRLHNERRLYGNRQLIDELNLDAGSIILFMKSDEFLGDYGVASVSSHDSEYEILLNYLNGLNAVSIDASEIKLISPKLFDKLSGGYDGTQIISDSKNSVDNSEEVFAEAKGYLDKYALDVFQASDDPLAALRSNYRTQKDFSDAVRNVYKGKCALRNNYYYEHIPYGLDAAHVKAKFSGGNNLPSNGMLLSTDLHRAYDGGLWTLSDSLEVIVHPEINSGMLLEFQNKKLNIPPENITFKPFLGYVRWHRETQFGKFKDPSNNLTEGDS